MNYYINILAEALIFVIVTDLTDFPDTLKGWISGLLTKNRLHGTNYRIHWIDCSLCQVNLFGIITMFAMGRASIVNYLYVLVLALLTPVIKDFIILIQSALTAAIYKIQKHIES